MELPDSHLEALQLLAGGHSDIEIDPELLDELRRWGMLMPRTLELTGMGARYAGKGERGVLE